MFRQSFFSNDSPTPGVYALSLHDALPFSIDTRDLAAASLAPTAVTVQAFTCDSTGCNPAGTRTALVSAVYTGVGDVATFRSDRKSTRLNSSHRCISYAVFCLKKKQLYVLS